MLFIFSIYDITGLRAKLLIYLVLLTGEEGNKADVKRNDKCGIEVKTFLCPKK